MAHEDLQPILPPPDRRSRLRLVGTLISVVSVAIVVWWAVHQPRPELPDTGGEWALIAGAVAVYALATGLRALRWRVLLERAGAHPAHRDTRDLTVVGFMGNNVLPLRGGDVLRVTLMTPRVRIGARGVIGTLLAERLLDVLVLLTLFVLLAYGVLRGVDVPSSDRLGLVGAGLGVLLVAGVLLGLYGHRHHWGRALIAFVAPMLHSSRDLLSRGGVRLLLLTLPIWLAEAGTWYLVGPAVGFDMAPLEALYLIALASVFIMIPSGPAFAGTLDAALVFGVHALGGTSSQAISYLIMLRFVLLVPITLLGLVILVARYGGLASVRRVEAAAR